MRKKLFKKYTKKDAEKADEFTEGIQNMEIPDLLNNFPKFRKYTEFYVSQNNQYGFNKLAEGYFKVMYSEGGEKMKGLIRSTMKQLCRTIDRENPIQNKIKGISAINMLNKYNERVEVKVNHKVAGYSPKEVMENLEYVLNIFPATHRNLVTSLDKKWDSKGNNIEFKFEAKGNKITGDTRLIGDQLIINSLIPPVAKPYTEQIASKIKSTLEDIFPKRNLEPLNKEVLDSVSK